MEINIHLKLLQFSYKNYEYRDISIISVSPLVNKYLKRKLFLLNGFAENFIKNNDTINLYPNKNTIKIVTAHGSKGLKWKVVYLLGVDDPGFNDKLYDSKLIYIGITRARELLRILCIKENDLIKRLIELKDKNQ